MIRIAALSAALTLALAIPASAQTLAITNARVHTMTGATLDGATVVVRDGRIDAVGRGLAAPAGARVIDAAGGVVTPGFIDSATQLGGIEIDAYPGTTDQQVSSDRITAAFDVADGYNPMSTLIPVTRVEGVTRAVVSPSAGSSLIAGQGIVVHLGEGDAAAHIVRDPAGMWVVLGEQGANLAGGPAAPPCSCCARRSRTRATTPPTAPPSSATSDATTHCRGSISKRSYPSSKVGCHSSSRSIARATSSPPCVCARSTTCA